MAALLCAALVVLVAPAPTSAAGVLSNGAVSPTSGTTVTPFILSVDYTGSPAAATVTAYLDGGNPISLALESGTPSNGHWEATSTLPAGTWAVTFGASPGNATGDGPTITVTPGPTPDPTPTPPPTPTPTPTPTASPSANPTPTPTSGQTPSPGASATLPPSTTPRPGSSTGPGATPTAPPRAGAPSTAPGASSASSPAQTDGVLGGNPTPSGTPAGNEAIERPSDESTPDPDDETRLAGFRPSVAMLVLGGTLSLSGGGYLALLAVRRRARHRT